jgi:hypothetical protein
MFPLTGGLASLGLSLVQADDRATVDESKHLLLSSLQ